MFVRMQDSRYLVLASHLKVKTFSSASASCLVNSSVFVLLLQIKQTYKRVLILEYSISTRISPDERMLSCKTHLRLTN
ncbi:hypothetical protein T10_8563 [Trichinella papuae]|uniref:Uncharacterized protein n=1 Tax=Trichinella papuae TaxID=268474 RepID=A0A0V1MHV0_9BILA|nr:hypothetical protein T10_8563 [Trichinella papuae]